MKLPMTDRKLLIEALDESLKTAKGDRAEQMKALRERIANPGRANGNGTTDTKDGE